MGGGAARALRLGERDRIEDRVRDTSRAAVEAHQDLQDWEQTVAWDPWRPQPSARMDPLAFMAVTLKGSRIHEGAASVADLMR
jgi:hypothetical protein